MAKELGFMGSSLDDLRAWNKEARTEGGSQLRKVQDGVDPDHWKPMPDVGPGTIEIKIKLDRNEYRIFYVAKFEEAVYVLHAFRKTTQSTSKHDIAIGKERYKDVLFERAQAKESIPLKGESRFQRFSSAKYRA